MSLSKRARLDGLKAALASGHTRGFHIQIIARSVVGSILVLSEQPMIAALVGGLLELEGCKPVFAGRQEGPAAALQRLRPLGAVLVDCEISAAESDLFFAVANRHGIRVVVFGSSHEAHRIGRIASARGISWFTLPPEPERLRAALGTRRKEEPRRRNPEMIRASDGTRILLDRAGRHWMVYDRRVGDRRSFDSRSVDRAFVAEDGEIRHCEVADAGGDGSAVELEAQLETAL